MKYHHLLLLLIVAATGCSKKQENIPDIAAGLVINVALDGNSLETVSNTSGVATRVTATANRHGEAGKAMQFVAADSACIDFGDLANASFESNLFTIACWVKAADTSKINGVLSKRSSFGPFEYSFDNHFAHGAFTLDNWISNGGGTVYGIDPLKAKAAITLNTWHHIAFVADSSSLRVYLDGVLQSGVDTRNATKSFSNTDAHFVIGTGGAYGDTHYFSGAVDDVRIYNKPLTVEVISYLAGL